MTHSPLLEKQFVALCREVAHIRGELVRQRWSNRIAWTFLALLCLLALARSAHGQPAVELAKAVHDVRQLPPEIAAQTRYLSLYNFPDESERRRVIAAVSMLANSASTAPLIARPTLVNDTLLRIDLCDYGWTADLWEALVADGEPYWHLTTEIAKEIKQGKPVLVGEFRLKTATGESDWYSAAQIETWINDGSLATERAIQQRTNANQHATWTTIGQLLIPVEVKKTQIVQTDGGWLNPADVAAMQVATGSRGAIIRADWFVAKLCEPEHYYAFAGIGDKQADHYKALGVDEATVVELLIEKGTNIFARGPTGKPGRIVRFNSLVGGVWATYDVAGENVGIKDPFRDPTDRFKHNFDAGESFVQGLNGLWQFNLYDAAGAIVGEADPDVATDSTAPGNDATLRTPISCLRCHAQLGQGGIIDLTYDQQRILDVADIKAIDPGEIERLQTFYGRTKRLEIEMNRDREDADTAAQEATGLSWSEAALAVSQVNDEYLYARIDLATVKKELAADDLAPLLQSSDPLVLAAAMNREDFAGLVRGQWESAFAEAISRVSGARQSSSGSR